MAEEDPEILLLFLLPPAPIQGCAGPPVRAADPDLFPRDSRPKARQRAENGDFFQTHLADSMSQQQPATPTS